jgi:glycosyltransferase involved in cell wall biosynthesis
MNIQMECLGPPRKKTVFVINSLTTGGAEHVLVELLHFLEVHLAECDVHLVLLDSEVEHHSAPLWVTKHTLNARSSIVLSTVLLARLLERIRPDVIISLLTRANCASVLASRILGLNVIISERTHTSTHFGNRFGAGIRKWMVRLIYPLAHKVIAVSHGVAIDLATNFRVAASRIIVISNPIDTQGIREKALQSPTIELPGPYIVAAGRLIPSKNFRLLIEAYSASGRSEALVILGEGEERPMLEDVIASAGLQKRVFLPGHISNPHSIVKRARLFVSSSNQEGFPNSIVEAMALGIPVVATDCLTGPSEILGGISEQQCTCVECAPYGILVPPNSVNALAEAIRLALNEELNSRYRASSLERSEDFARERSAAQYWSVLSSYLEREAITAE